MRKEYECLSKGELYMLAELHDRVKSAARELLRCLPNVDENIELLLVLEKLIADANRALDDINEELEKRIKKK